ncbi:hypothetical protein [Bifidobacterium callitrichidarum]|uniref:Uncharacterized protein n=1 Tax=Bifidobacterium callitrichidarum TaxID=2052941 RepID=A0A2U2N999_9BIFI|nr:hypothetical protein [Bifidobacterium callitrichidarum]PWG65668.1 hypothetical protein DF196_06970 [Bifidobacterium callitrichidarum]
MAVYDESKHVRDSSGKYANKNKKQLPSTLPTVESSEYDPDEEAAGIERGEELVKRQGRILKADTADLDDTTRKLMRRLRANRRGSVKDEEWGSVETFAKTAERITPVQFGMLCAANEREVNRAVLLRKDLTGDRARAIFERNRDLYGGSDMAELTCDSLNEHTDEDVWRAYEEQYSPRLIHSLAKNPAWPHAQEFADQWLEKNDALQTETDRASFREFRDPEMGALLSDRDDIDETTKARLRKHEQRYAEYAEYKNRTAQRNVYGTLPTIPTDPRRLANQPY